MSGRSNKYRAQHYHEQGHRCYYCNFPMWMKHRQKFAKQHGISVKDAARFKATAEHKIARVEGGTSRKDNIVAACQFCNQNRHRRKKPLPSDRYLKLVRRQVARRSWHPIHLFRMIDRPAVAVAAELTSPPEQSLSSIRDLLRRRQQVEAAMALIDASARRHVEGVSVLKAFRYRTLPDSAAGAAT